MRLVGSGSQQRHDTQYDASGQVGTSAILVLGLAMSRSSLFIQNVSSNNLAVEIGAGWATATITNGAVSSIAVNNAGFNYTYPPSVHLLGGGKPVIPTVGLLTSYTGLSQPNAPSPQHPAKAVATLSGNSISAITVTDGGSGYAAAPYVMLVNSSKDPNGAAAPVIGQWGIQLSPGQFVTYNGTFCPTDPVAVIADAASSNFVCKWTD